MWDDGWIGRLLLLLLAACVGLVAFIPYAIFLDHQNVVACRERGGEMVVVGHHTALRPQLIGKTTIMIPYEATDYECSIPEVLQ